MAFSDFDFNGTQETVFHSGPPLTTNPLTVGGTYARRLAYNAQGGKIYYKTTAYGGAFYNTPNTKVLSLRAHVRKEGNAGIFLIAKDSATFASSTITGYSFGIGNDLSVFLAGNNNNLLNTGANAIGIAYNTWISLRMDIFPLGALGDRIICYKETAPGSGVWSNIINGFTFDVTVNTADSAFVPWSNNGRCGIYRDAASGADIYIDNLNFTTYNAP